MLSFAWKEPKLPKPLILDFLVSSIVRQLIKVSFSLWYILTITAVNFYKRVSVVISTFVFLILITCAFSLFLIILCQFYLFKELLVDFFFSHSAFNFTVFWTSKTGFYFLSSACFEFILLFFPLHSRGGSLEYKFEIFPPL